MNSNVNTPQKSHAETIKEAYTIEELTRKCGKYFNAYFDADNPDHVTMARNKVYDVEYKNGIKRSRPQISKMTQKFKTDLKKGRLKPKTT